MSAAFVSELRVYPLKSARGIEKSSVSVGPRGLSGDRDWMIVDGRGRFVSQRTCPEMAMLTATPSPSGLELRFPTAGFIEVSYPAQAPDAQVEIWSEQVRAADAGAEAAAWLSHVFDRPLRLVWLPLQVERQVDPEYAGPTPHTVSFADGYPVLIANMASLEDLNRRLPRPITMARFRPNIVVTGWAEFEEDRVRTVRCGPLELTLVKPCTRCSIPSLDPLTGAADLDPTPVLKGYRYDKTLRGVTFGVNALVTRGAGSTVEIGQPIEIVD